MTETTLFTAYPASPAFVGQIIENAAHALVGKRFTMKTWAENDTCGRPIVHPIFAEIAAADAVLCDITKLNFNVSFEAGYAIGINKRLVLTLNTGFANDSRLFSTVGIFDTLGYASYQNTEELIQVVTSLPNTEPLVTSFPVSRTAPLYLVEYPTKSDALTRIISRIKKTRLRYRSFNPQEHIRLSALSAIEHVASSNGVIIPLASQHMKGSDAHNIRAAFVAGLSYGMRKPTLVLQDYDGPAPIDVRDFVCTYKHPDDINKHIADFGISVIDDMQRASPVDEKDLDPLVKLAVGDPMAENEMTTLSQYYLDTDEFQRVLRGEANLVVGRKGMGKTALFTMVRDRVRRDTQNIVVDLKPEGYQLKKLREELVDYVTEGAQEHLFVAFWEYLLYLEIAFKLLEKDADRHKYDHSIADSYRKLEELHESHEVTREGDFSERLLLLSDYVNSVFRSKYGRSDVKVRLTQAEITELIYSHQLPALRQVITTYLKHKKSLWILFDNLDKGWPAQGADSVDALMLRSLVEAGKKIKRELVRAGLRANTIIFVRNDVYEILMENDPDFGKDMRVGLDWSDREQMKELIRRRLTGKDLIEFDDVWRKYFVALFKGEESYHYLVDRSLMRPRNMIKLIIHARSYAVNMRRARITGDDIEKGLASYSNDVLQEADEELADIEVGARDLLYRFIGEPPDVSEGRLKALLTEHGVASDKLQVVISYLLYYGFFGIKPSNVDPVYIYDLHYNMKLLEARIRKERGNFLYHLNPAFWPVLGING